MSDFAFILVIALSAPSVSPKAASALEVGFRQKKHHSALEVGFLANRKDRQWMHGENLAHTRNPDDILYSVSRCVHLHNATKGVKGSLHTKTMPNPEPDVYDAGLELTPEVCYKYCADRQTLFFALQNGKVCMCFDNYDGAKANDEPTPRCDVACGGAADKNCGGTEDWRLHLMSAWVPPVEEKPCGFAPSVDNSLGDMCKESTKETPHVQCEGRCKPGYTESLNTLMCDTSSGKWMGTAACAKVVCGAPKMIPNGLTMCTGASAIDDGGSCEITCKHGYELARNDMKCSASSDPKAIMGIFIGRALCNPVSCGKPPGIRNTKAINADIHYGQTATFNCQVGFTLDGTPKGRSFFRSKCQIDGTFKLRDEDCKPVQCGLAPVVENAEMKPGPTNIEFPNKVTYECNEGYAFEDSGSREFEIPCLATGDFGRLPRCKPIDCGLPKIFQFSRVIGDNNQARGYMEKVDYACQEGYSTDKKDVTKNNFSVICGGNALFSTPVPCKPVCCGNPPFVKNSFRSMTEEVSFGDIVFYKCQTGYTVTGKPGGEPGFNVDCFADGKFGAVSECLPITCEKGGRDAVNNHPIDHAQFDDASKKMLSMGVTYSMRLTYICDEGYSVDGTDDEATKTGQVSCGANGKLSTPKTCKNINDCEGHTCGPFGNCTDLIANYTCKCTSGYEVQEHDGEYVCGNIDDCGPFACGKGTCKDLVNDYTCECDFGHVMTIFPTNVSGRTDKVCEPKVCGEAPEIEYTVIAGGFKKMSFGDTLQYSCKEGYSLTGEATGESEFQVVCNGHGQFDGTESCKPITCGVPSAFPGASVSGGEGNEVKFPLNATYECAEGHTIDGVAGGKTTWGRACLASGVFDHRVKKCKPVICGVPTPVFKAVVKTELPSNLAVYGVGIEYACATGYSTDQANPSANTFTAACGFDGKITGVKQCKPVTCELEWTTEGCTGLTASDFVDTELRILHDGRTYVITIGTRIIEQGAALNVIGYHTHTSGMIESFDNGDATGCPDGKKRSAKVTYQFGTNTAPMSDASPKLVSVAEPSECVQEFVVEIPERNCDEVAQKKDSNVVLTNVIGSPMTKPLLTVEFGAKLEYKTIPGYHIEDSSGGSRTSFTMRCGADGKLKGKQTPTKISCGTPPTVEHSSLKSTSPAKILFEEKLTYECARGYAVDETPTSLDNTRTVEPDEDEAQTFEVTCAANGQFTGIHECYNIDDCEGHDCGQHGTCVDGIEEYSCSCFPGYFENTTRFGEKVCGNIDDCGPAACGQFGTCIDQVQDYTCDCFLGYEQATHENGKDKVCKAVTCATLPKMAFSTMEEDLTLVYPKSKLIKCQTGYSIDGSTDCKSDRFRVRCRKDKTLSPAPTCRPVMCGSLPTVEFGLTTADLSKTYVFQEEAKYKCKDGYTLDGTAGGLKEQTLLCGPDGSFTAVSDCLAVNCGAPPSVAHAEHAEVGKVEFPATLGYTCDPGFSLDATDPNKNTFETQCLADGSYRGFNKASCPVGYVQEEGVVYWSNHRDVSSPSTVDQCGQRCKNDNSCVAFSFWKPTNDCWLYSDPKGSSIEGTIDWGVACILEAKTDNILELYNKLDGDCFGANYKVFENVDLTACLQACSADSVCTGSSYGMGNRCVLKNEGCSQTVQDGWTYYAKANNAVPIIQYVFKEGTEGNGVDESVTGSVNLVPNAKYTVSFEILRNDLGGASEYVKDVRVNGESLGECHPDGGDHDCTFFKCPFAAKEVVCDEGGAVALSITNTGHSRDCDCDKSTWGCHKESTVSGLSPMKIVGKFVFQPVVGQVSGSLNSMTTALGGPVCTKVKCGSLPTVARATVNAAAELYFGDVAEYTCDNGATLDGTYDGDKSFSVTCGADGQLSNVPVSTCKEILFKMEGIVSDATNLAVIAGIHVTAQDASGRTHDATTDSHGKFNFARVPASTVTLKAASDTYIGVEKEISLTGDIAAGTGADLSLSPKMRSGEHRFVLTWGEAPRDLDSHVYYGSSLSCHLYYSDRRVRCHNPGVTSHLDVDDTSSYGPETVTLEEVDKCRHLPRGKCHFYYRVKNYSGNPDIRTSGATLKTYEGDSTGPEYRVDQDGYVDGVWWYVFRLDGRTGQHLVCRDAQCDS